MALNLPNPRAVALPEIPASIKDEALRAYLKDLRTSLELQFGKQFDNAYSILVSGTEGSFLSSGGATITVQNGIVTGLS